MAVYFPTTLSGTAPVNIGFINATTTNANDSVRITGSAAALSTSSPLIVPIMSSVSAGRMIFPSLTSDVTINLTGAHWGQGTKGDLSAALLRIYAINDSGTLKVGVGYVGGRFNVADTDTSITGTSVTAPEMLLVNSALTAGTWPCRELGGFVVTFDDTGGAAEDLWAVGTTTSNFIIGPLEGVSQTFNTAVTGFSADPTWTSLKWSQNGRIVFIQADKNANGTSNQTFFTFELPVKARLIQSGYGFEVVNNGALTAGANNIIQTRASSVVADLYLNAQLAAWSNVNAKSCSFFLYYEAL